MKMNDFRFGVILFTIVLLVTSCAGKKFEKGAWTTRNDALFPPVERTEMLDEVLSSHKLVGMNTPAS